MAEFRLPNSPPDTSIDKVELLVNENTKVDLWGDGPEPDYALLTPSLDDTSIASFKELKRPGAPHLRQFELHAKLAGTTNFVASTADGKPWAKLVVWVPTPEGAHLAFIVALAAEGAAMARKYQLPVSLMIAQACLESAYGTSPHARYGILFGITKRSELSKHKEPDWYPRCQTIAFLPTEVEREVEKDGKKVKTLVRVTDRFCFAGSYEQAVEIWCQYVTRYPTPTGKTITNMLGQAPWTETDLRRLAAHMFSIGFGSNLLGSYPDQVMSVINKYKLIQYD
ncbi:MAG TPA: glucosaminidase domain-containing protein [Bryobacteraceae bacterium]|jgi:hypothetical protein